MKTKHLLFVLLLLSNSITFFAQSIPDNFGFTGSRDPLAITPDIVAPGTNIIATDIHVYYVAQDQRVHDIVNIGNSWVASSGPLGGVGYQVYSNLIFLGGVFILFLMILRFIG